MAELSRTFPPPPTHPAHKLLSARAELLAEQDLSFHLWLQELKSKRSAFFLERAYGGSGLPMANSLREFFREYASRLEKHGPHAFPTSFNVMEGFLAFSHKYFAFDLRDEREHLLRLYDYVDWYTSGSFPENPNTLTDILEDGVIYSYNLVGPEEDFRLQMSPSEIAVAGVALVRHDTELSIFALCGEKPPDPPDEDVDELWSQPHSTPRGKEGIEPNRSHSIADRYSSDMPDFARLLAMVRFDLVSCRFNVRYICQDLGDSYFVITDDPAVFDHDTPQQQREEILESAAEGLAKYQPVFSFLASAMYLPVFFIAERNRVKETMFSTELQTRRNSTRFRKAVQKLGRASVHLSRRVSCIESLLESSSDERAVSPPDMEFATVGFWKTLQPGQIGEDEAGNPISGKTWVERTESWSSHSLETFVIRKSEKNIAGPDVGYIYVMRSGSHGVDIYKIGKTRRQPDVRAHELAVGTGVPTGFDILATWEVADVDAAESEIHLKLRKHRINKRREFFRAPLPIVIAVIQEVVKDLT